jgi:hypothetical protein
VPEPIVPLRLRFLLEKCKLPGFQIPAELIQAEGEILHSEIHKLIKLMWNKKNCLTSERSQLSYLFTKTDSSNYRDISLLSTSYTVLSNFLLCRLIPYADEIIGITNVDFNVIDPTDLNFCICQILEKKWEYNGTVHQLFIDFKKAYVSVRREVLYSIPIEFGTPKKLVLLIKCV